MAVTSCGPVDTWWKFANPVISVQTGGAMAPISSRRLTRVVAAVSALLLAAAVPGPAAAAPSGALSDLVLKQLIKHMTLEEKVGQLFVTQAWGESATDPSAADKANNQTYFG